MSRSFTIGGFTFIPLPPPPFPSEGLRVEREYSAELGNFKDSLASLRGAYPGRMSDEQTAELEAKVSLRLRESLKFDLSGMNLESHSKSVLEALERQNPISKMASGLSEFIETATTREVIDEEAKRLGLNDFLEGFKEKNPAHSNVPFAFYKYALRREFNLIRRQASQLERPRNRGILMGEESTQQAQKFLNKELAIYQFALEEGSQYPKEICIKQTATLLAGGSLNIALSNPASRKFESRLGVALPSDSVLLADQLSALEAIESAIIKGDNNKGGKAEIRIGTGGGKSFLTDLIRDSYADKNLTFTEEGKIESKRIGAITTIDLNSTDAEINAVFDLPTASSQVLAGSIRSKKALIKVTGDLNGRIIQLDEAYFFGKFDRINNDSTTPEEVENKRNEAIAGLRRRGATVIVLGASESPDKIKIEIRRIEEKIAQEENKIEQDSNRKKGVNRDTVNIGSLALGKFKKLRYLTHNTKEFNQTTREYITTKVVVRRSYNDIKASKGLSYVEDAHAILNLAILGLESLPKEAKILKDLLDGIVKGSHPNEKKKKEIFESLTSLLEQTDLLSGFDDDRKDASVILNKLTTKLGVKKGQYHSLMDRREGETEEKKGKTREKFEDSGFVNNEREMDLGGEMSLLNLIRPDSEKPDESYLPKLEVKTKENEKGESGNSGEKLQYILPDFIINEETCSDEDLKEIARLSNADIVIVPHKDEEGKLRCRIFRNDEVVIADVGDAIKPTLGQIADKKVVSFFARTDDKWRGNATGGDYGVASLGITHQQIQARTSDGLNFNKLMQAYGRDRTSPLEAEKYPAKRTIILHENITKEQFWKDLKTKTKIDDVAHAVGYLHAKQRQAAAAAEVFTGAIRGASSKYKFKYKEYENEIYQQNIQSDQRKPKVDVATASSAVAEKLLAIEISLSSGDEQPENTVSQEFLKKLKGDNNENLLEKEREEVRKEETLTETGEEELRNEVVDLRVLTVDAPPPLDVDVDKFLKNAIALMETYAGNRIDLSRETFGKAVKTKDPDNKSEVIITLGKNEIKQLAELVQVRLNNSRFGGLTFDFDGAASEDVKKFLKNTYCADFRNCTIKNLKLDEIFPDKKKSPEALKEKEEILKNFSTVKFLNCQFEGYRTTPGFRFRAENIINDKKTSKDELKDGGLDQATQISPPSRSPRATEIQKVAGHAKMAAVELIARGGYIPSYNAGPARGA